MIEAGVQGLTPIIGKEVEEMELDNFQRIDDYIEEWGAETTGKGSASYCFENALRFTGFFRTWRELAYYLLISEVWPTRTL